jgi:hypothetical protein
MGMKPLIDPGHSHHAYDALRYAQMGAQQAINSKFTESNMSNMLAARMGWNVSSPSCSFQKISAHKLNEDQAAIFVIAGQKALVIHDDLNLFPSDALVTQLRLLENNK